MIVTTGRPSSPKPRWSLMSSAPTVTDGPAPDPSNTAASALDNPGSVSVSCLLMQDALAANIVSMAAGDATVALFANPYLGGKEEALIVDETGHLSYLRRASSETGWSQG